MPARPALSRRPRTGRTFLLSTASLTCALLLGGCTGALHHPQPPAASAQQQISAVLQTQSAAWNRGDIDGFMAGYWHSASLRFASGDTVTWGWQPTLERYRAHYPDRSAMGTLQFTDLDIELLAPDAALVFGHWALQRRQDRPHGVFTLLFRLEPDGWKITRDHTSAAP